MSFLLQKLGGGREREEKEKRDKRDRVPNGVLPNGKICDILKNVQDLKYKKAA